jgi:hypothetical protein
VLASDFKNLACCYDCRVELTLEHRDDGVRQIYTSVQGLTSGSVSTDEDADLFACRFSCICSPQ